MSSKLVLVADAVVSALAAATFTLAIVPRRGYVVEDLLQDMDSEIHVDVVPSRATSELEDRNTYDYELSVDIAVRKRLNQSDLASDTGDVANDRIDELIELLEEINEHLAGLPRLTDYDAACWRSSEIRSPWIQSHLRQNNQYTGVLRVAYSVDEAI